MNKQEFEELSVINKVLGGKYDAVVQQLGTELAFGVAKNQELIGFGAFKEELKSFLNILYNQLNKILIDANVTEKYLACRIHLTEGIIAKLNSNFSAKWKYINTIGEKLKNAVSPNITVNELKKTWGNIFLDLISNVQENDPAIKNLYQKWLLDKKTMAAIKKEINLSIILTKEMLNPRDLAFVDHKDTYATTVKTWYNTQNSELKVLANKDLKVVTKNLDQNQSKISNSSTTAVLKDLIIKQVKEKASGLETIATKELVDVIQDAIFNYSQLYTETNGLAFKDSFFYTNYIGYVENFQLPNNFDEWLEENSVSQTKKEIQLQKYLAGFGKWQPIASGVLETLKSEVSKRFILDKSKFKKVLTPLFIAKKTEKSQVALVEFVSSYILEGLEEQTNLIDLEKHWEDVKMSSTLLNTATKIFETLYSKVEESEWKKLNSTEIFNYFPKAQELVNAVKASPYKAPKIPEPKPPHPDPEPSPRTNPLVVFEDLEDNRAFNLCIKGTKVDCIFSENFLPTIYQLNVKDEVNNNTQYKIYLEYDNNGKKEIKEEQTITIVNANESIECIFKYKSDKNSQEIFEYKVPFMPDEANIYSGTGQLLQTIKKRDFKAANDWSFECLSKEDLGLDGPQSSITDFYIQFKNTEETSTTVKQKKMSNSEILVGFAIENETLAHLIDLPFTPQKAYLTQGKSASDKPLERDDSIGSKSFFIGKNIRLEENPIELYLHIKGQNNEALPPVKLIKSYKGDQWEISLNLKDNNPDFDNDILKNAIVGTLHKWKFQIADTQIKTLATILDKETKPSMSFSFTAKELLNGVFGAIAINNPVTGVILLVLNGVATEWVQSWGKDDFTSSEEIISAIQAIVSMFFDAMGKDENMDKLIKDAIKQHPECKTTGDLKLAIEKDLDSLLQEIPKEITIKVQEVLNK